MQYLLAIYGDEKAVEAIPEDQMEGFMAGWFKYDEEVRAAVNVVHGSALQPTSTATTVRFKEYRWMHSTRAELLRKLGRNEEAGDAYRRALALTENSAERSLLSKRLSKTEDSPSRNS